MVELVEIWLKDRRSYTQVGGRNSFIRWSNIGTIQGSVFNMMTHSKVYWLNAKFLDNVYFLIVKLLHWNKYILKHSGISSPWIKPQIPLPREVHDLGQVNKRALTSSTHPRRKCVRLQIPLTSATVQRKERKETEQQMKIITFLPVKFTHIM